MIVRNDCSKCLNTLKFPLWKDQEALRTDCKCSLCLHLVIYKSKEEFYNFHKIHNRRKLTSLHLFRDLFHKEILLTLWNKCKVNTEILLTLQNKCKGNTGTYSKELGEFSYKTDLYINAEALTFVFYVYKALI